MALKSSIWMPLLAVTCAAMAGLPSAAGAEVKPSATLEGHKSRLLSLQFTPDGKKLVSTSACSVCIWDAKTYKRIYAADISTVEGLHAFCGSIVSPNSREIATGFLNLKKEAGLLLFDTSGEGAPRRLSFKVNRRSRIDMIGDMRPQVYTPDGKTVLAFSREWRGSARFVSLRAWNPETGKQTVLLSGRDTGLLGDHRITAVSLDSRRLMFHSTMCFLRQVGGVIGATSRDHLASTLTVFDLGSGKTTSMPIPKLNGRLFAKPHVRYSPTGNICAVVNDRGSQILLWELGEQKLAGVIETELVIQDLQFSLDGKYLGIVSNDLQPTSNSELSMIAVATGETVADRMEQKDALGPRPRLAFSPAGNTVAVGGYVLGKIKFFEFRP